MENVLEIQITKQDLKQPYNSATRCPIATAIRRTIQTDNVRVASINLQINNILYHLRSEDDRKARMRGDGKLLGKLLGGFKVVLHKIHWT